MNVHRENSGLDPEKNDTYAEFNVRREEVNTLAREEVILDEGRGEAGAFERSEKRQRRHEDPHPRLDASQQ